MEKKIRAQFWIEFITDLFSLTVSFIASFIIVKLTSNKIVDFPSKDWAVYILLLLLAYVSSFFVFHSEINVKQRSKTNEFLNVIKNNVLVFLVFMAFMILVRNHLSSIRILIVSTLVMFIVISCILRYYLKRWITNSFTRSRIGSYVGVLTTKDRAEEFIDGLKKDWSLNITGVALLDNFVENGRFIYDENLEFNSENNPNIALKRKINFPHIINGDVPVIATDVRFMEWIRSVPLDEVFINLPYSKSSDVQDIIEELETMGITVHLNVPTLDKILDESKFDNINCKIYAGCPTATFAPTVHNVNGLILKRVVDMIGGIFGAIISIPIILITAIPLLIESPGPLIFKQERVGQNGRIFKIYKLRSMYVDAEERKKELMSQNKMDGLMFKMDNDPRITKVGKIIRKLSIDELPQFFNVIKGDMSLVGTRPPTVKEFEQYESRHKRRLSMRPGITGNWQVSGRSDIQDFEEVVKLDCQYIDEWNIWLDIKILLKTVWVVLTHKGAE